MTFDVIIDAFAAEQEDLEGALREAVDNWDRHAGRFRALLHGFIVGEDASERTERALFYVTHLLGGQGDTGSFADLCALALDPDRFDSVLGDDGTVLSYPSMLVSTFAGTVAPLQRLIEHENADDLARGDALLVLAYLTRTGAVSESATYDYLAALPGRLQPREEHFVWFGYARAVAALGFSGLSGAVEQAISRGYVEGDLLTSAQFWHDLRAAQQDPNDFGGPVWDSIGPMGDPLAFLSATGDPDAPMEGDAEVAEPVRNPLRNVGRNDPCPCGSGKKYKKCCLQAA